MSFQTLVLQQIAQIQTQLNEISANAKKVSEFATQTTIVPTSKLHVDNAGTSESLTIQQIITAAAAYGASIEVIIDGFKVEAAGKLTLTAWEDGDKFRGWVGNIKYEGRIIDASALTMPDDILDTDKVSLAQNAPAL